MKRAFLALVVIAIAALIGMKLFGPQLGKAMFERAVAGNLGRDITAKLPDGLHVAICGSGSPMSDPTRAGPCTAIIAGKRLFIVDIGSGAARNLGPMGLPIGDVDAVFLTHFHSDHIDGLGELMTLRWATGGNKAPLPVYGPSGVEAVVGGFNAAYTADRGYRVTHHGDATVPAAGHGAAALPYAMAPGETSKVVYDAGGVKVTAFTVDHDPITPAVGYRFDYGGRSVVLSGDTEPNENVVTNAKGADLLVHEALHRGMVKTMGQALMEAGRPANSKIMDDIQNYHTSPLEAARIAEKAGVRMLVLSHIVPIVPARLLYPYFLEGTGEAFGGAIVVAEDGMLFSLPKGSAAIIEEKLD